MSSVEGELELNKMLLKKELDQRKLLEKELDQAKLVEEERNTLRKRSNELNA